ncbi:cytochrome P460 family protein [Hyphomicrobium sp. B1]|uniref:cytochrome P460 family protein n=1 Tax=Hyphomicrobium sp. B1 TaxID=3075651 RepID=UPI003C2E43E3
MKIPYKVAIVFACVGAVGALSTVSSSQDATSNKTEALVDNAGNLKVPSNYRATYEYLGSWAVADDKGQEGSKQIHTVYASPGTIEAYRTSGKFPDGSALVKEVFAAKTQPMTTGTVSHEDKLQGWFMMVKDDKNAHPENNLWGDGWAWSWFDASNPNKTTSTNYKNDCKSCHEPAQATDWVYTNGYPSLQKQ